MRGGARVAGAPRCSLVRDVTGGEGERLPGPALNAAQRRFLTLFLASNPDRLRACWLDSEGLQLGPVADHRRPPPGAARLKVYHLADGSRTFRGAREAQRVLAVADLAGLDPLWATPLRDLNTVGRAAALEAREPTLWQSFRLTGCDKPVAYRQTPASYAALKAEAARQGRTQTDIINEALSEYLARRGRLA